MAVYKIVEIGDPVLKEKSAPVRKVNERIVALIENMNDTLAEKNGLGLAAPQIGISKRVIVLNVDDIPYELINPEITRGDGEQESVEGCLSVPGVHGKVKRLNNITVKGLNRHGELVEYDCEGLLATVMQHEIDHLDGILFVDKAHWVARER